MADLIVITGGACSGKTSVINELAARGFATLPESAFAVIAELNDAMGVEAQVEWRKQNLVEFQRRLTRRQFEQESLARRNTTAQYVFCDRGLLDGRAYCLLGGRDWPDDLNDLAADARYAHLFILETLTNFNPRHETGRFDTLDESRYTAQLLEDIYTSRTDHITHVPEMLVSKRTDFILNALA